jgi:DedD protein
MNAKKHRIVGAIVLIALAIIFIPMLFQERNGPDIQVSSIPERPAAPTITKPVNLPAPTMLSPQKQSAAPAAWSLQLASFTDQQRANELLKRLQKTGYASYTRAVTVNNVPIIRVYVGPEFDQDKLKKDAAKIQITLRLKGTIVPFKAIPGTENG